jgi:hypothetical protein
MPSRTFFATIGKMPRMTKAAMSPGETMSRADEMRASCVPA